MERNDYVITKKHDCSFRLELKHKKSRTSPRLLILSNQRKPQFREWQIRLTLKNLQQQDRSPLEFLNKKGKQTSSEIRYFEEITSLIYGWDSLSSSQMVSTNKLVARQVIYNKSVVKKNRKDELVFRFQKLGIK